jgi:hypothetical protein
MILFQIVILKGCFVSRSYLTNFVKKSAIFLKKLKNGSVVTGHEKHCNCDIKYTKFYVIYITHIDPIQLW